MTDQVNESGHILNMSCLAGNRIITSGGSDDYLHEDRSNLLMSPRLCEVDCLDELPLHVHGDKVHHWHLLSCSSMINNLQHCSNSCHADVDIRGEIIVSILHHQITTQGSLVPDANLNKYVFSFR